MRKFILSFLFCSFASADVSFEQWREAVDTFPTRIEDLSKQENFDHYQSKINDVIEFGQERSHQLISDKESGLLDYVLDPTFLGDLKREFKIVPFKWITLLNLNLQSLKNKMESGYRGMAVFVFEILKLLGLFLIPFLLYFLTQKMSKNLVQKRENLIRGLYRGENNIFKVEALRVLSSYGAWVISLISIFVAEGLLKSSLHFSELAPLVSLLRFYIYFRVFRMFVVDVLVKLSWQSSQNKKENQTLRNKARAHSGRIAGFVMFSMALNELVASAVSKGLIYILLTKISFWIILVLFLITASEWKKDISSILKESKIPFLSTWLADNILKKSFFFLCLPSLMIVVFLNMGKAALSWAERFDFVKRITAQVFKKKLEGSENLKDQRMDSLPEEYSEIFHRSIADDPSLFSPSEGALNDKMLKVITDWRDDIREENSIALVGERGIGKTTLLSLISDQIEHTDVCNVNLTKKITAESEVYELLTEALGVDMSGKIVSLMKLDKVLEKKKVIIIDNAHNCFLSKLGCFEAYKTFLEIINARLENLFFVFSFDLFSWNYLSSAFSRENNFRHILRKECLSEKGVRELVLKRHDKLDYGLSFYDILKATGNNFSGESKEVVFDQFFRLLWEQSLGNPKVSLNLWLSSLKFSGGKKFRLGLPHDDELEELGKLNDSSLFVYAAIVKHENLSVQEIRDITHQREGDVRFAIRYGLDNGFLIKEKNRKSYKLHVRYQYPLINHLKKKNLVYAR